MNTHSKPMHINFVSRGRKVRNDGKARGSEGIFPASWVKHRPQIEPCSPCVQCTCTSNVH